MRHAQSEENVKIHDLLESVHRIASFSFPNLRQIRSAFSLLQFDLDSPLTSVGLAQIQEASAFLIDSQIISRYRIRNVFHSPLRRSRETCLRAIPTALSGELECLREANPLEHIFHFSFVARIRTFERWLCSCPYDCVLVVGHSQYFKKMLKMRKLMQNCDIWETTISYDTKDESIHCLWSEPELLFRTTQTTIPSPKTISDVPPLERREEEEEEEVCRICQV